VLRDDLHQMRDALDKYYGDNNRYPDELQDLVTKRYLRRIPPDPFTGSDKTWVAVAPKDPRMGAVADVKSGAQGNGRDGTAYKTW
jgi:general secretion pathway protein G